jgi:uncharacterized protein YceK
MVFMKLRISIIALGVSLLVNAGCSSVKSAYNGDEGSHFTNPAKVTAMNNAAEGLPQVAEAPEPAVSIAAGAGGTGVGAMTGLSTQPEFQQPSKTADASSWGGSLSDR